MPKKKKIRRDKTPVNMIEFENERTCFICKTLFYPVKKNDDVCPECLYVAPHSRNGTDSYGR